MEIVLDEQVLQRIEKETPNRISIKIAHPDMAKNIDRVKGKQLAPVKEELSTIRFRKDTSDQLAPQDSK